MPADEPRNVQGLDLGPSTIAAVGETTARVEPCAAEVVRDHAAILRPQRHLDRQRRANNPNCYDDQGRAIRGNHPTTMSRRQDQTGPCLADGYRREADHRQGLNGRLANQLLQRGIVFKTEQLSYRACQKVFGRSVGVRAPTLSLWQRFTRKAESASGQVLEFSTRTTAVPQHGLCTLSAWRSACIRVRMEPSPCNGICSAPSWGACGRGALPIAAARASWPGAEQLQRDLGTTCEGAGPVFLWPATRRLESRRVVRARQPA